MPNGIPIAPAPSSGSGTPSAGVPASTPAGGSSSGSSGGGKSGGGGGPTTYAGYLAAQRREANKAKKKASDRYKDLAETLSLQAKALRFALDKHGFKAALKQKLDNVMLEADQADAVIMEGYGKRVGSLTQSATDNENAAAGQSYANLSNAGRERANAMSEAMAQGAGESDTLRAQGAALRNWNANQNEVERSYFDTLTSVNSSLTDLNVDTKTARANNYAQANADRGQLWDGYRDQRAETQTQLGNTYGQMAEYYGMALEQVGSKKTKRRQKKLAAASGDAFMDAAHEAGKAWDDPGIPGRIQRWNGQDSFASKRAPGGGPIQGITSDLSKPEGATLRKWEG